MSLSCKVHVKNSLYIFTEVNGAIFIKSKTAAFRGAVHNHALHAGGALLQKTEAAAFQGAVKLPGDAAASSTRGWAAQDDVPVSSGCFRQVTPRKTLPVRQPAHYVNLKQTRQTEPSLSYLRLHAIRPIPPAAIRSSIR